MTNALHMQRGANTELVVYASKILGPFDVSADSDFWSTLEEVSSNIHACPVRGRGRSYDHIRQSVGKGLALEFALAAVAELERVNNGPFDPANPLTYAHDLVEPENHGVRFEVKTHKKAWLSWSKDEHMRTFLNNSRHINYLVSGEVHLVRGHRLEGVFRMIARAYSFQKYCTASQSQGSTFYHHKRAADNGQAVYLGE